jgi:hypothetical protein
MRRREVILLFREISERIPEAYISTLSLTQTENSTKDFGLKIGATLDASNLEKLQTVVTKHGLQFKEDSGSLLIYGSKQRREMQIAV